MTSVSTRVGWMVVAALAAAVTARVPPARRLPLAIGVRGVERRILIAAYPIVVFAGLARRRALSVAAGALAVLHIVASVRARGGRRPHPIDDSSLCFRLVTANLLCSNSDISRLSDEIAAEDADVVLLQEVTPEVLAVLRRSCLWSAYPHRRVAARPEYHGAATFSRFPVVHDEVLDVAGSPMLRTDLATPRGRVRVVNVHTVAPLTRGQARRWDRQMAWLGAFADADASPVILAGDFNATGDHAPFRRLLRGGLRDAFDAVGRGSGATWPSGHRFLPALLRLDHVVTGDGIGVGSLRAVPSVGSDHARLVAELGIPDPLHSDGQASGSFSPV
ncbi:endonuclease/exonuclease/phosphatase family protein [Microbacterium enclense]|uniref:endonuclease/exonuclease/phosphatase family protein n=1 Tax=Microbacterium enclense TaxID=993073 RepID=UPI003D73E4A3